jgi:hypothetical protein
VVESFYFVIITMTTVGYGDAAPKSPLGKVVASVTALSGVVIMCLPIAIIAKQFDAVRRPLLQPRLSHAPLTRPLTTFSPPPPSRHFTSIRFLFTSLHSTSRAEPRAPRR